MDINTLIGRWKIRYKKLSLFQKKRLKFFASLLLILLLIMLTCCMIIVDKHKKIKPPPLLVRKNDTIIIPKDSSLRSHMDIQTIRLSNAPRIVSFPGVVEADPALTINILPSQTGHLEHLEVTLGEEVKKGQTLALLQSSGLAQAYTDKIKAQAALKLTEEALQRAKKVNHVGANAIKDIEQMQNNYIQAHAEMTRARATLQSLGAHQESQLQIKAPIDGKIIAMNYGQGSYINDPTIALFTLSNISSVWVTACIPEYMIASVAQNQNVHVTLAAYPNQYWKGKITFINNIIDPDTRCNKSRISLVNSDNKLQPNMFATVHTQIPQSKEIMIPLSAIFMNNDNTSVFIETAPWVFKRRAVVLGTEEGNNVRITSGLKAGERIAVAGGILVND